MMDLYDDSWCPSCGRQILPQRVQLPQQQQQQQQQQVPAPPPSSPQSSPTSTKKKTSSKVRGGLVQGTGRVKPNGAIKASTPPPPPPPPTRTRTVVDPAPLPLYCSDECKALDLYYSADVPALSPSTSSSSSSTSSSSSSSSRKSSTQGSYAHLSPSIATLAALYNFPPLPRLSTSPSTSTSSSSSSTSPTSPTSEEYTFPTPPRPSPTTVNRSLSAILPPKPPKKPTFYSPYYHTLPPSPSPSDLAKPIPGWTDGSHAWRATVYNLTDHDPSDLLARSEIDRIYRVHHSTPLRSSKGVKSTVGTKDVDVQEVVRRKVVSGEEVGRRSVGEEEMLYGYHASFARRHRERTALVRGKDGEFVRSSSSLASGSSTSSVASGASEVPGFKRPVVETRSWSYDNCAALYTPMKMPQNEGKKLFLFNEREVVVRR